MGQLQKEIRRHFGIRHESGQSVAMQVTPVASTLTTGSSAEATFSQRVTDVAPDSPGKTSAVTQTTSQVSGCQSDRPLMQRRSPVFCWYCNNPGHIQCNCPWRNQRSTAATRGIRAKSKHRENWLKVSDISKHNGRPDKKPYRTDLMYIST